MIQWYYVSNSYVITIVKWGVSCSVMPNPLWPHGLQPTRLLCPWHFPGRDTGVGCHFLFQITIVKDVYQFLQSLVKLKSLSCAWLFSTPGTVTTRLLCPWNFPGKSTGVGCHFLLQEIFLTQGSNLVLPHCRWMLYHLSHQGSPQSIARQKMKDYYHCKP